MEPSRRTNLKPCSLARGTTGEEGWGGQSLGTSRRKREEVLRTYLSGASRMVRKRVNCDTTRHLMLSSSARSLIRFPISACAWDDMADRQQESLVVTLVASSITDAILYNAVKQFFQQFGPINEWKFLQVKYISSQKSSKLSAFSIPPLPPPVFLDKAYNHIQRTCKYNLKTFSRPTPSHYAISAPIFLFYLGACPPVLRAHTSLLLQLLRWELHQLIGLDLVSTEGTACLFLHAKITSKGSDHASYTCCGPTAHCCRPAPSLHAWLLRRPVQVPSPCR